MIVVTRAEWNAIPELYRSHDIFAIAYGKKRRKFRCTIKGEHTIISSHSKMVDGKEEIGLDVQPAHIASNELSKAFFLYRQNNPRKM